MSFAPQVVEAQFPQLAAELLCVGLAEVRSALGEEIDVERGVTEFLSIELFEPFHDLGFEFDCTPGHSTDAIERV